MRRVIKYIFLCLLLIPLIPAGIISGLYFSADMGEPVITADTSSYRVVDHGSYKGCGAAMLRRNSAGLWELYTEGNAVERGMTTGALTKELMRYQEDVFIKQIRNIIPSEGYLKFLRIMIIVFNRNLGEYIPQEYREEIYASSLFCTHEYDAIGSPYERQLNYHAAHDIGHAMQQYMLVGCSSFAAWGGESSDSSLIAGRNFDFYVGDDFAKNKLITFCAPDTGYRFASIGWAGMAGVLSGMNEKGLTVTINAAKGSIPVSAATPISLLAREILQYASTIEEAYAIAGKRKTFVSESILIASAADGKAAIIEKTPDKMALYRSGSETVICTNHYQSGEFENDKYNIENIADSDSKYRFRRLEQLAGISAPLSPVKAAEILRDQRGMDGKNIGLGNEMSLNQSIAHHSVIFRPEELKMWVSTSPWQSGEYICYDLREVFSKKDFSRELTVKAAAIPADSAYIVNDYPRIKDYRTGILQIRRAIRNGRVMDERFLEDFLKINPDNYYTYRITADYYLEMKRTDKAKIYYEKALRYEIPYNSERKEIEKLVKKL